MDRVSKKRPAHIAIIGCGFTGTSAFFQTVRDCPVEEISIFEGSGRFGPGYAYQPDECSDYLMNNSTDEMCIAPENRRAFIEWLGEQAEFPGIVDPKSHLPRSVFGRFLEDSFSRTLAQAAAKGIKVNLITKEVSNLKELPDGRIEITAGGVTTCADAALLATGRCPDLQPCSPPPAHSPACYLANHIGSSELEKLGLDAEVHVLGASLSAYDIVNRLFSERTGCRFERNRSGSLNFIGGPNQRRVILCSRSGRLKSVKGSAPLERSPAVFKLDHLKDLAGNTGLALSQLSSLIQREAELRSAAVDWRAVAKPYDACRSQEQFNARAAALLASAIEAGKQGGVANFLPEFFAKVDSTLWHGFAMGLLSEDSERLYRNHYEALALAYMAPCPIPTAERLLALMADNRLAVIGGTGAVTLDEDGAQYRIEHQFGVEKATVLVNATSCVDRDVTSPRQPALIRNLVDAGLMKPHRIGAEPALGAAVDMTNFRVSGSRSIYLANMLLWGPGFFTSSAFTMATVVSTILSGLFGLSRPEPVHGSTETMGASTG